MPQITIINGITIEHYGDVPRGLQYLEKEWHHERTRELFDNARRSTDQDTHFQAYVDGAHKNYVLKHIGSDRYFLKPRP